MRVTEHYHVQHWPWPLTLPKMKITRANPPGFRDEHLQNAAGAKPSSMKKLSGFIARCEITEQIPGFRHHVIFIVRLKVTVSQPLECNFSLNLRCIFVLLNTAKLFLGLHCNPFCPKPHHHFVRVYGCCWPLGPIFPLPTLTWLVLSCSRDDHVFSQCRCLFIVLNS